MNGDPSSELFNQAQDAVEVQAAPALSPDVREALRAKFERWLDGVAAGQSAPEGLPTDLVVEALGLGQPTVEADLYTVFSTLASLKGEIGLQGRAFKQLTDAIAPVAAVPQRLAVLEAAAADHAAHLDQVSAMLSKLSSADDRSETGLPPAKDVLAVVFDLQSRLERGIDAFDETVEAAESAEKPGILARLFGKTAPPGPDLASLREGYTLTLGRVQAAMQQWGIERVGEVGEPFEPGCMQAIEVAPADGVEDGTILEVYRSGYVSHGRVLETAKVKVAKGS